MNLVYDSSALLNIVRLVGDRAIKYLKGNYILTFTPYEVGNALWKESALLNMLSIDKAVAVLQYITQIYRIMNIVSPVDVSLVFKLASEMRITFYDSSYIVSSFELNAGLVTDDNKLRRRIGERSESIKKILGGGIKIYSTQELIDKSL